MPKDEVPVQTRVPAAAHRQIAAIAKSRGTSVYNVCRDLLVAQLGVRQGAPYASMLHFIAEASGDGATIRVEVDMPDKNEGAD